MTDQQFTERLKHLKWNPQFKVPRKLKKEWRKRLVANFKKHHAKWWPRCKLHWNKPHGWTVTYHAA